MQVTKLQYGTLLASVIIASFLAGCNEKKTLWKKEAIVKNTMIAGMLTTIKQVKDGVLIVTTFKERKPRSKGFTDGASFTIKNKIASTFSGKKILIEVVISPEIENIIRQGEERPTFAIAYSTPLGKNSGWKKFPLKLSKSKYRFVYKVPRLTDDQRKMLSDHIGIISDTTGKGRRIFVYEASILKFK